MIILRDTFEYKAPESIAPMFLMTGPPLPQFLGIHWPWVTPQPPGSPYVFWVCSGGPNKSYKILANEVIPRNQAQVEDAIETKGNLYHLRVLLTDCTHFYWRRPMSNLMVADKNIVLSGKCNLIKKPGGYFGLGYNLHWTGPKAEVTGLSGCALLSWFTEGGGWKFSQTSPTALSDVAHHMTNLYGGTPERWLMNAYYWGYVGPAQDGELEFYADDITIVEEQPE